MLTIAWSTIHSQKVTFQASTVIYTPKGYGDDPEQAACEFYTANHDMAYEPILFGNVYVMNENGKTVAVHELGGWDKT